MEHEDVILKLRAFIKNTYGTSRLYADHIGVKPAFVSHVLNGVCQPTNYMLHDIGVKKTKTTVYSKIKGDTK